MELPEVIQRAVKKAKKIKEGMTRPLRSERGITLGQGKAKSETEEALEKEERGQ